jgi:hypothetical protein
MVSGCPTLGYRYVIQLVSGVLTVAEGKRKKVACENNSKFV